MHFYLRNAVHASLVISLTIAFFYVFVLIPIRERHHTSTSTHDFRDRFSLSRMEDSSGNPASRLNLEFGTSETDIFSHDLAALIDGYNEAVEFGPSIREVRVSGWKYPKDDSHLIAAFEHLKNLETVHWSTHHPIPPSILHLLEIMTPSCKLHYTLPFDALRHPQTLLAHTDSILNSTLLHSLKADISYSSHENFHDIFLVFSILTSSPNLRSLDLSIEHWGCVFRGWTPYAFNFRSSPDAKFPPLEVLKLQGYHLDEESDGGYAWYWKDLPYFDYQRASREDIDPPPRPVRNETDGRTNLDCWLKAMDWSQLHTLDLSPSVTTLEKLRGAMLPSLKHVAFSRLWSSTSSEDELSNSVEAFLNATVQPLESISLRAIQTTDAIVAVIANRHAKELRSLTLGNFAGDSPISKTQMTELISPCSKIHTLNINIPRPQTRESSWDFDTFDPIIQSGTIEHLILRFPSPDDGMYKGEYKYTDTITYDNAWRNYREFGDVGDVPDPHINTASVQILFSELQARHKKERNKELEKLDVYTGEWELRRDVVVGGVGSWQRVGHWECIIEGGLEKCVGGQTRSYH